MIYEIHCYVPKTGQLTPAMIEWLMEHGQSTNQPEFFWPVKRLKPKAIARHFLNLDNTLIPVRGPEGTVELRFPNAEIGITLFLHDRGVIIFFPYMAYSVYSRIVLGIVYTYIRFLFDLAGFWSFDPQLNVLSYADDFHSMEETSVLMDAIVPKLLNS
ncbi:MAG: hypothetical protein J0M33_06430 [Anaerolineae bacterium]|nr:hypothetical protein [Anaerolineae bacterium]